jgi:hypothetical protein
VKPVVLAYHSHNIAGRDYLGNDHVALASDLATITGAGGRVVPLGQIAEAVRLGDIGDDELVVGLSFDDGPRFDFADFEHPRLGPQRGFLGILRDFDAKHPGAQRTLHATSFVIASPEARAAMERAEDCGYPDVPGWLGDSWWSDAVDSGLLGIGNHSWDHVHHAVDPIATSSGVRDDFSSVDNYEDADREIRRASGSINDRIGGRCSLFAFPFGHTNPYRMVAAFGTGGRRVVREDSVWNIPRAVCGYHWKSPQELRALLAA